MILRAAELNPDGLRRLARFLGLDDSRHIDLVATSVIYKLHLKRTSGYY
jgi:hypothetical protein